ncbi:MAG: ATP-binding cassette domain-containing protein [Gemmatimonadaceae bacterium]
MLVATAISKQFGPTQALRGAGFTARPGEVLGIIGPNGSGKSTLLACAAGLVRAESGELAWKAHVVDGESRREVVFFMPDGISPWAEHRVHAVMATWRSLAGRTEAEARDRVRALSLDGLLARTVRELSKGERKRLLIALALLAAQPVLLLDEPFDGLDLRQLRDVAELLRTEARRGRTVVLSLHQLADAPRVCDRLALLDDGRIVAEGTLDELRAAAGLSAGSVEELFLALT